MKSPSETETKILDAAEELFAEQGFDATSIRDICTLAGANIAAVHYHFGDKEQLYIEAVKRAHACSMEPGALPPLPPETTPKEKLRLFIWEMTRRLHAPAKPKAMKLLMREMADPGKASHIVVQEFIQPVAFYLRSILRDLFPKRAQHTLYMIGFSIIGQILFYRQNRPLSELIFGKKIMSEISEEMVAEHIVEFTFSALKLNEKSEEKRTKSQRAKGKK